MPFVHVYVRWCLSSCVPKCEIGMLDLTLQPKNEENLAMIAGSINRLLGEMHSELSWDDGKGWIWPTLEGVN